MPQQIVIAEQLRIAAVLTDDRVDELVVAQGRYQIGDVYLGTVENVPCRWVPTAASRP